MYWRQAQQVTDTGLSAGSGSYTEVSSPPIVWKAPSARFLSGRAFARKIDGCHHRSNATLAAGSMWHTARRPIVERFSPAVCRAFLINQN